MAASDESASSRLIEVLSRIDTTLGTLDRRLQALEQSWQPPQPAALADPNNFQLTRHKAFLSSSKLSPSGSRQLQEIRFVERSDLLTLLSVISSPCLNRNHDSQPTNPPERIFTYPFTKLLCYRDILKFVTDESASPKYDLGSVFSHDTLTARTRGEVAELLGVFDAHCEELLCGRDANLDRGVVLFDHLPTIYSPGMLLLGPGEKGLEQVVEVSSYDMVSTSATSEACVVEFWHLRWEGGEDFSRTSGRFELSRYSGTRPINGFLYRPVFGSDSKQSLMQLEQLVLRNGQNLALLEKVSKVKIGDYPHCSWVSDIGHGIGAPKEVVLDPVAFSLYNEEGRNTQSTFCCYCATCTSSIPFHEVLGRTRYRLLAPTRVEGFIVGTKKWATFPVRDLLTLQRKSYERASTGHLDENAIESLKQDLDRYLFERREALNRVTWPDANAADMEYYLAHRGSVVAVQFHGPDGAGKSFVALSLAAHFQRPAIYLRPADLGQESGTIGEKLSFYAELSFRWGAVLIVDEADKLLGGRQRDDMARNAQMDALVARVASRSGAIIFLSSHSTASKLDPSLVRYIRQITFRAPFAAAIRNMFHSSFDRSRYDPDWVESRDKMVEWLAVTAETLKLSLNEVQDIYEAAMNPGDHEQEDRRPGLGKIIKAFTETTGRPDEWDFVSAKDTLLCGGNAVEGLNTLESAEGLLGVFGHWSEIPDDGRLALTFSKFSSSTVNSSARAEGINLLSEITERLLKVGSLSVIDWGWPDRLWRATKGCAYRKEHVKYWPGHTWKPPREQWAEAEFTFGLRSLLDSEEYGSAKCGNPWRRLVLFEGLGTLSRNDLARPSRFLDPRHSSGPVCLPWVEIPPFVDRANMARIINAHLDATTLKPTRPNKAIVPPYRRHMSYNLAEAAGVWFHIVFFEVFSLRSRSNAPSRLNGELPLFGSPDHALRKGCFTIFPIPAATRATTPAPLDDPIHWTLVCLTTLGFWPYAVYATCQAPTVRAQLTYYVAEALAIMVGRWREVLQAVENLVDSGEVLRQSDHLQDILFDDDTFSTSKRYFWAINLIHEAVRLLDDSIQQWIHHRRWSVTPWKKDLKGGREYYWFEKSQEVLANAERQGEEACEDLRLLRQEFQERLERITVMRDGLFNASAVMESRASTQLGENVKLLTFVSIFFLPLGLCVAIWSINESYSRTDLAIVTAIVAVATYSLTLNLNNLVRGLQKLYAPKRRALIEQMTEGEPDWERLAHRFKAFQRSEDGQRRPSEWMIAVFLGKRAVMRVGMALRRVRLPVRRALRRLRGWGRRGEGAETSGSRPGVAMETVQLGG